MYIKKYANVPLEVALMILFNEWKLPFINLFVHVVGVYICILGVARIFINNKILT